MFILMGPEVLTTEHRAACIKHLIIFVISDEGFYLLLQNFGYLRILRS